MNNKIKMENKFKETTFFSISLILLLAMSLMMPFVQPSLAQVGVPQPVKTEGYISVAPTLIGVDQSATVNLWVFPMPTNYAYRPYFKGFEGVTVTFTKPDGTKDTFAPVDGTGQFAAGQTQSLGGIYFSYAPDMEGNWSVSFTMPEQNLTDNTGTVLYQACTSNTAHFTVQTEPVLAGLLNGYPWSPLPNDNVYWSYPINSNNREWNAISGDWLNAVTTSTSGTIHGTTTRNWQPYGSGPNTGHIVWDQPIRPGGLIGGDYGSFSYGYAVGATSVAIMAGKVFINIPNSGQFQCIDLATGKILYTADGSINGAIHIPGNAYSQSCYDPTVVLASSFGSNYVSYLFQSSAGKWNYYDPFTGALVRSISNASSARLVDGTNLAYGASGGKLYAWNMANVTGNNWPTGITWEVPLPTPLSANAPTLFGLSTDASTIVVTARNQFWGYSSKDGSSLWNLTLTYPVMANEAFTLYGVDDFVVFNAVDATFNCYSITSGALLWTSPSLKSSPWATTWTVYSSETNDYDNLYLHFPDGIIRALSLETGELVWESTPFASTEYTNNAVPHVIGIVMVGGNIYSYAGYSINYQLNPIPRFAMMSCVNATTGDIAWTLNGGVWPAAAANGYLIGYGVNDGNLYCLGKGQTQTTVTAPLTSVPAGTSVLIQGSVMDLSDAALNTPAVSDEDVNEWMDYLHMQNATLLNNAPKPDGVTVRVAALDSNGEVTDLGTATSDYTGQFAISWTPPTEGIYKIFATFDGSNSYFGSYAETALSIGKAAETSTTQQQTIPDYTMTIIGVGIAIIAVIIAVAIATVLILRKRA